MLKIKLSPCCNCPVKQIKQTNIFFRQLKDFKIFKCQLIYEHNYTS